MVIFKNRILKYILLSVMLCFNVLVLCLTLLEQTVVSPVILNKAQGQGCNFMYFLVMAPLHNQEQSIIAHTRVQQSNITEHRVLDQIEWTGPLISNKAID